MNWRGDRWRGIERPYSREDVELLRGSWPSDCVVARELSEKFWSLLKSRPYVFAIGALTGGQAIQMIDAGFEAIYVSGWQIAADANENHSMYPDLGLYPSNSGPTLVRRIIRALRRADQLRALEGRRGPDYFVPLIADGEAGFGGPLHVFELVSGFLEAGAASVHLEDQHPTERRCGHLGGKVLAPLSNFKRMLVAARLAADVLEVPMVLIARTDAEGASYITSDHDPVDSKYIYGERTPEGYFKFRGGLDAAIDRALEVAPLAELVWFETKRPSLDEAKEFAKKFLSRYPEKMLAYNLSPSFNWKKTLSDEEIAEFQSELGRMGYKFQFITLAGFHALNASMFELAKGLKRENMPAYVELQEHEFELERDGYRAAKHQSFVGVHYYDKLYDVITGGEASAKALAGSTESEQFVSDRNER
ncbi:MAG: isocitrate lyase [Thaumarchaeota archaeon]|nr:isocitrate lyase [Candidatus Calditenuaceae archaeon]MDW8187457.1 isocitrate lyase [Nitrososphaerota archaeon]